MDRCALFVDANYALGEGAFAVHGTRNRDSVSWDYAGLLKLLGGVSRDSTGLPLLRCYWYDVAATGSRAAEHETLADLAGVKVRLSKARPSRKEGLEAEIRKDLAALARNRAVSDVIIVSAEEDLAPVIAEVQDLGVRAVLLTVGTERPSAGARSLRQECDDIIEVSPGHLRPYVDLIAGAEPASAAVVYREIPVGAGQAGAAQAAIEPFASQLYASHAAAGYERAPQLASLSGQAPEQPGQLHPAAHYQHADSGALTQAAEAGYQQAFAAPGAARGQGSHNGGPGEFSQRGMPDDGRLGMLAGGEAGAQPSDQAGFGGSPAGYAMPAMVPNGLAAAGMPANGMPGGQSNGVPAAMSGPAVGIPGAGGLAGNGVGAAHSMPAPGGANGLPQNGVLGGPQGPHPGQQGGFPPPGQQLPAQQPAGQQLPVQPHALPQPGQSPAQPVLPQGAQAVPGHQIAQRPVGLQPQSGLMPLDSPGQLQHRQLPAGNGMAYSQDRSMPYPGQVQQAQGGGPAGQPAYPSGPYGVQQPSAPAPPALSVGDAVQSAHAEGFGFGEAVARDAPALWLEAVLARKPRMPSDLEARLLQGSALPIDSLLHDEVRHALRRGFWDALERSRH